MTYRFTASPLVSSVFDGSVPVVIVDEPTYEEAVQHRRAYRAMNYFVSEIEQVNQLQEVEEPDAN